jgi:hypothetical protein
MQPQAGQGVMGVPGQEQGQMSPVQDQSGQGQTVPAFQASAQPVQPLAAGGVPGQAVLQAKQAVAQYGQDPARLSAELARLKSAYLATQFGISSNAVKY